MKFYQIISILALATVGFTSCEEIIDLELENAEPRIVIDALVDATGQSARVFLTKSNGFYESINLDFVTDAIVHLTLSDGSIVDLPMVQDGIYIAFGLNLTEGDILTLTVIDGDGKEYKATENVPHEIAIDSLQLIPVSGGPGGGGPFGGGSNIQSYQIFTHWQDVEDKESFYRIKATVNDTLLTGLITISDDVNRNGEAISQPLFQTFEAGDTVTMELSSIDGGSYRYLNDLSGAGGPGFNSTTPFNPKSNFDNNALGYFGIIRTDEETIILP